MTEASTGQPSTPLWRLMQLHYFEGRRPGSCEHRGYAAEILALVDWLDTFKAGTDWLRPDDHERVRSVLLEEARKAREGK